MSREVTTQTTCDLCGALDTKTQWVHELPGIGYDTIAFGNVSFTAPPAKDYCDDCTAYVKAAIDRAKEERRAGTGG